MIFHLNPMLADNFHEISLFSLLHHLKISSAAILGGVLRIAAYILYNVKARLCTSLIFV